MAFIRLKDLAHLVLIASHAPLAWFVPERAWRPLTRVVGRWHVRLLGERSGHLRTLVPNIVNISSEELELGFQQHVHWELLENLREWAPWGWNAELELVGEEHIVQALAARKGVIIWFCPFVHADIAFKKALHRYGYKVNHLSSFGHGFSNTTFGMAVLNPVKTRIELRYIADRCVITRAGAGAAVRRLIEHLKANEIVSIAAVHTGRRYAERSFLGGTLRLAMGGPNIALTTGAALLPTFVTPIEGGYRTTIHPPLVSDTDNVEAAEEQMIDAYVPLLKRYVSAHPVLWRGWLDPPNLWRADE